MSDQNNQNTTSTIKKRKARTQTPSVGLSDVMSILGRHGSACIVEESGEKRFRRDLVVEAIKWTHEHEDEIPLQKKWNSLRANLAQEGKKNPTSKRIRDLLPMHLTGFSAAPRGRGPATDRDALAALLEGALTADEANEAQEANEAETIEAEKPKTRRRRKG